MLIAQQINDFITAHGKPICDRCICTGLKLTALAHSAQITAALDTTSDFNRTRAECSVCHNQRAVIHAQRV